MIVPIRPQASPEAVQAHVDRQAPTYRVHLNDLGCSPGMVSELTGTARQIVAWLAVSATHVAPLDIRGVGGFLSHDCDRPAAFRIRLKERFRWQAHRRLGYLIETGQATVPSGVVTGGGLVDSFADTLTAQGYCASTFRSYHTCCRHVVVWLYLSDLSRTGIDGAALQRFVDHDCDCEYSRFFMWPGAFAGGRSAEAIRTKFTDFLVDRGGVTDWRGRVPNGKRDAHVNAFLNWLRRHRAVRDATLRNYHRAVRALQSRLGGSPGACDAASTHAAILHRAQTLSRGQSADHSTTLRSYLSYLAASGMRRPSLAGSVASITAQLPRYVEEADIELLIVSCDTANTIGFRDRAVLLLALRAGDIAAMRLGDINWEQSVLAVSGKSRRSATLPLAQEVDSDLKDYILQARPRAESATVFLRSSAPHRGLSGSAVGTIVGRAMKRTWIAADSLPATYLFRHSPANHLLRGKTPLETVGALLRHQSVKTTALYARVDLSIPLAEAQA